MNKIGVTVGCECVGKWDCAQEVVDALVDLAEGRVAGIIA